MPDPRPDSEETVRLLDLVRRGDADARSELLDRHRDGLRAFLDAHFDRALRGREDPSDIAQKTLIRVNDRLPDFLARRPMPFHLWARKTAYELLLNARRDHRAGRRDVAREAAAPDSSSMALADRLAAGGPTPSEAAEARERAEQVARAVERLDDDDREILLLRQVDDLPYDEIARLLDITAAAARQRYGRALVLLEKALAKLGVSGGAA